MRVAVSLFSCFTKGESVHVSSVMMRDNTSLCVGLPDLSMGKVLTKVA